MCRPGAQPRYAERALSSARSAGKRPQGAPACAPLILPENAVVVALPPPPPPHDGKVSAPDALNWMDELPASSTVHVPSAKSVA
mmetsp:Transcript_64668/g.112934  ORF Transcript_64668/g.112934 Transcript_64668/m.112934 type:complete len:84 (+) Transcript_64668:170-421(+)